MKIKLLIVALAVTIGAVAQTTHHINNWGVGITQEQASITIDVGDTVMWTWSTNHPHSVTSIDGSMETFDSGTLTGIGQTFSHTFTMEGINPYECVVHPAMQGTITVEEALSVENFNKTTFEFYPNPVTDILTINADTIIDRVQIYDVTGKVVMDTTGGNLVSKIYMQNYNAGTYFVKLIVAGQTKTKTIIKQ